MYEKEVENKGIAEWIVQEQNKLRVLNYVNGLSGRKKDINFSTASGILAMGIGSFTTYLTSLILESFIKRRKYYKFGGGLSKGMNYYYEVTEKGKDKLKELQNV